MHPVIRLIQAGAERIDLRLCSSEGECGRSTIRSWRTDEHEPDAIAAELDRERADDCDRLRLPAIYAIVGLRRDGRTWRRVGTVRQREAPEGGRNPFVELPTPGGITEQAQRLADTGFSLHAKTLGTLLDGYAQLGARQAQFDQRMGQVVDQLSERLTQAIAQLGAYALQVGAERARHADADAALAVEARRTKVTERAFALGEKALLHMLTHRATPRLPASASSPASEPATSAAPTSSASPPEATARVPQAVWNSCDAEQKKQINAIAPELSELLERGDAAGLLKWAQSAPTEQIGALTNILTPAQAETLMACLSEGAA